MPTNLQASGSLVLLGEATIERWAAAAAADPYASPFQGPTWIGVWADHRAEGPVVVRDLAGGEAAVAEVVVSPTRRSLAGGRDVTDYRGPVGAPGARLPACEQWLSALEADGVTELDLHGIASDSGWLDDLAAAGDRAGWSLQDRATEDVCPRVALAGDGPEAWLDRIDGKERHELRRKGRKLARDLGGMHLVEVEDVDAGLTRFWELAVTSQDEKGDFFADPKMKGFFEAAVPRMSDVGALRIHELVVGGLPAASMISLVPSAQAPGRRDWGLYNSAFDATLGAFAPGTVLAAQLATLAASEGFEHLDFLRGDEAYKYRFGAVDLPIESALLVRR